MKDNEQLPLTAWLPTTMKEARKRGWDELDVIIISGDAYVDHPAFGNAVIGRIIESMGLRVAIVAQPNWQDDLRDFKKFGKPRLFFGVSAGNMDSMVNKYTAGKRLRSSDAYTPGGETNHRPDYASIVYSKILKELYPDTPEKDKWSDEQALVAIMEINKSGNGSWKPHGKFINKMGQMYNQVNGRYNELKEKGMTEDEIYAVIQMWLDEPFGGGRHQRRIDKLDC